MADRKNTVKKEYLHYEQIKRLILGNVKNTKFKVSLAFELIIVFNKVEWYSMFWNPMTRLWRLSKHNTMGWGKPTMYTTDEFDKIIKKYSKRVQNIRSVQYRDASNIKIYYNNRK